MNKVARAVQIYIKAAAHPFTIGFGLFMMIGMLLAFIIDPDPVGSDEYLSMLGVVQMANFGIILMIIIGNARLQQNKFYCSCSIAKEIFIYGPIWLATTIKVLYDVLVAVFAYINLGIVGLSDTLVFSTISTVLLIIVAGCFGKSSVPFVSVIAYVGYMSFLLLLPAMDKIPFVIKFLGLPLWKSVIIAVSAYIISITVTLMIEKIWWKKGDRFAMPYKFVQDVLRGQANE